MSKKHPWLCAGTTAIALLLCQQPLLAEEPPQEEKVEIEVHESVQQVAEQAAEAAKAIAAEAATEAQETASRIAAEAAEHAREAAEEVVEEVTKAAGEAARKGKITSNFTVTGFEIGIQAAPVPKALDAQLKLDGVGVLIDDVNKEGAAAEAGVEPHDIVISIAGHDVKSPRDVAKAVAASKGEKLQLNLLRGGEKLSIAIQPKPYGQINANLEMPKVEIEEEIIKLESKIREKLKGAGVDVRMHVIRPGQTMPDNVFFKRADLPEDVAISVRREGGKPAKIELSRGEEKWEVIEDDLDKLPEDLRPHVEHMLGRGPIGIGFPPNVKFTAPLPPGMVIAAKAPVAERHLAAKSKVERASWEHQLAANQVLLDSISRTMQEIKKDIHRLYDQIDELREDRKRD